MWDTFQRFEKNDSLLPIADVWPILIFLQNPPVENKKTIIHHHDGSSTEMMAR